MLFGPSKWLFRLMELTNMPMAFKEWLLCLAIGGFTVAWLAERRFFPNLARFLGRVSRRFRLTAGKQRRQYKVLLEDMKR
jgi:cation-transporting ATPase 13A3/4/5